tara:strand:+ start:34 stop:360 length:327 start_codon:yes stop_codon:yes gene_type:complete
MARNPKRSITERIHRKKYIKQHGTAKGGARKFKRDEMRQAGQKRKTALAIIPGEGVRTILEVVRRAPSVKIYNGATGKLEKTNPHNVGMFQKLINSWRFPSDTDTGRR